jgi:hypothetical protein
MMRRQPPCYRVSLWKDGAWRPYVTRTREPMRLVRELICQKWDRKLILIELRPGKGIRMPTPDGPTPVVMAGRVVSA